MFTLSENQVKEYILKNISKLFSVHRISKFSQMFMDVSAYSQADLAGWLQFQRILLFVMLLILPI